MKPPTVLVLGNPLCDFDNLPKRILPVLRKAFPHSTFLHWDPTEELPESISDHIILIDTVIGISSIQIFHDLKHFQYPPRNTAHDFDAFIALSLLKKLEKITRITIIGVPPHTPTHLIVRKCEAQLMHGS